ncbi:hypothetical protein Aau02nite_79040 [Amorphoplanes auranticolor]|uniref:Uncharacterized protein n=1 Tax=Actinoplanes auranticolor TaxID=47988 RepID=A0A919SU88_9ACTN|nr:hypothetical protein Aau02nite_79040 [Actinoplanes auranticolor]
MKRAEHGACDHPRTPAARDACRKAGGPGAEAMQAFDHANCDHAPTNAARKRCRRKLGPLRPKHKVQYVGGTNKSRGSADLPIVASDGPLRTSFAYLPLAPPTTLESLFDPDKEARRRRRARQNWLIDLEASAIQPSTEPATPAGKGPLNHKDCNHPCTTSARRKCHSSTEVKWVRRKPTPESIAKRRLARDRRVWAEEAAEGGPVVISDLGDPRVRAEVRRIAAEQEARLHQALFDAGLHIAQSRFSTP